MNLFKLLPHTSARTLSYSPQRTAKLILRGSLVATSLLAILLIIYDVILRSIWLDGRLWVIVAAVAYLFAAEWLLEKKYQIIASWMLILFYVLLAFCTLLTWGLNAPVGILTISFAVILPSILMGARSIMPVMSLVIITLVTVQILHTSRIVNPNLDALSLDSTLWDVITYSTILVVFALSSWLASSQREKNLNRALEAERALIAQKDALSVELEKESSALRLTQLRQVRQLHNFALLGQSTAATLHELSNHLSVLNLDIDDLQQHTKSKAIASAKTSLSTINEMVRQTRQQLNSYNQVDSFNAVSIVNQSVKDMRNKYSQRQIKLSKIPTVGKGYFPVSGSSFALMQIVTILLNNALDACCDSPFPEVKVTIENTNDTLLVSVLDNGAGVDPDIQSSLFQPITSTKSSGMGVGLYIAKHLVESQFDGNIEFIPSDLGAHFVVSIPRKSK